MSNTSRGMLSLIGYYYYIDFLFCFCSHSKGWFVSMTFQNFISPHLLHNHIYCSHINLQGSYSERQPLLHQFIQSCPTSLWSQIIAIKVTVPMAQHAVKVHHRYTTGLVQFWTDHFMALSCMIKMSPWSLGFAMVLVLPMVLSKQVMWLQVQLPNLDTAQNCIPIPQYHRYKQVFQPTVSTQ